MSDNATTGDRVGPSRMPHQRAALSVRELRDLRDLPEPRPRQADWMVVWPFSLCLPLDSHYCCVHGHPHD